MTFVASEIRGDFSEANLFQEVAALSGETYREVKDRRTFKFSVGDKYYFAKIHFGVGWKEILKNLVQLRLPVLGAANEWRAIHKLQNLKIDTMTPVAYSSSGLNPARIQSCLVTQSLEDTISLEFVVLENKLTLALKRQLLRKVGHITKVLHSNGLNHRDLYICHFLLPNAALIDETVDQLFLIDLHRAQIRTGQAPKRWREKDLASLIFSAADAGLTHRDVLRFLKAYLGPDFHQQLQRDSRFWSKVIHRAMRLYQKDHGRPSTFLQSLRGGSK
jgi:serine/threonine protein kinase